jgi:flagellar hook-associated protein 2
VISLEATTAGTPSAFTVTSTDTQSNTLGFAQLSAATNAQMTVNGINIERSSNTVDDVIEGATLNLIAPTSGTATISVTRNNEGIKARIATLVDAYNTAKDKFSDLMTVGGSNQNSGVLSGDGTMRFVSGRVKDLFTGISSTATDNIAYLNDIGVSFTRYGLLEIDEDRLDAALNDNYTDVVSMLSADTDNQSNFGVADRGLAGDAIVTIRDLMANDGALLRATASLEARADDYADALADLELRMESLKSRYLAQFTAMETAIDQINSTKDYLTNALEGLPFNNRNK